MAVSTNQFKLNTLAKNLGLKSKDLVDVLASAGIETKTTTKTLEPYEFDVLFDALTKSHQITDIGAYLDGVTYIPSKVKKELPKVEKVPEAPNMVVRTTAIKPREAPPIV